MCKSMCSSFRIGNKIKKMFETTQKKVFQIPVGKKSFLFCFFYFFCGWDHCLKLVKVITGDWNAGEFRLQGLCPV